MNEFPLDRGFLWLLLSCVLALSLVPPCMRLGKRLKLLDDPSRDARRVHHILTPRIGGLVIAAVFLPLAALIGLPLAWSPAFIAGYVLLVVMGIIDDRGSVRPVIKLAGQTIAMASAVIGAGLSLTAIPLMVGGATLTFTPACMALCIFIGVGLINAINLIDGLDGLATGLAAVSAAAIAIVAGERGQIELCLASMCLVGCLIGVLGVNAHPAKIFLGDTGSMLLGYLLSCLGLTLVAPSAGGSAGHISVFWPLLLLAIPWADSLWVMFSRLWRNRDPFEGDRTHAHHQVLGLGIRHRYAVLGLIVADCVVAGAAILLRRSGDLTVVLWTAGLVLAFIGGLRWLTRDIPTRRLNRAPARWTRWQKRRDDRTPLPQHSPMQVFAHASARWTLEIAFACLLAIYALSAVRPSGFLGLGSLGMLVLLGIALAIGRTMADHFVTFSIFAATIFLAVSSSLWLVWQQATIPYYGVRAFLLAAFVAALFELHSERRLLRLVQTPLELLTLIAGIGAITIGAQRYYFNQLWMISSALGLFVILKALGGKSHHHRFPLYAVGLTLVIVVLLQAAMGGLWSPLIRLTHLHR